MYECLPQVSSQWQWLSGEPMFSSVQLRKYYIYIYNYIIYNTIYYTALNFYSF